MFTTLCLIAAALFSTVDPAASGWQLIERMGFVEPVEPVELAGLPVASVQLDLLPDDTGAARLAEELRSTLASAEIALDVHIEELAAEPELPPSYRVSVGPFTTFEDAERAREQLEALGLDGFVRAHHEDEGASC